MFWSQKVNVPSVAALKLGGIQVIEPGNGIYISAVYSDGVPPLVLLAENSFENNGASVTNCIEHLINYVNHHLLQPSNIEIKNTRFIQIDSENYFDLVVPFVQNNKCQSAEWLPVANEAGSRTIEAFLHAYGEQAEAIINMLQTLEQYGDGSVATCIGCGCTDVHACVTEHLPPCHWLAVDYDAGLGVCSSCDDHVHLLESVTQNN